MRVTAGKHGTQQANRFEQIRAVKKVYGHPDFSMENMQNDIAILEVLFQHRLRNQIKFEKIRCNCSWNQRWCLTGRWQPFR